MAILKITSNNKSTNKNSKKKIVSINKNKPVKIDMPKKKKNKKRISFVMNSVLSLFMFVGIVGMVLVILFCGYIVVTAPKFDNDKFYNKEATIFYNRDGVEFARVGTEQRELVTYDDLPNVFVDALVATEDARFFQHNGFDVVRFVKASLGQFTGQEGAGGASTITMQLAKNTFSVNEAGEIESDLNFKGIVRKFHDIYISIFLIEKEYTKEQIIEFYVNRQNFGSGAYGVEAAAQKYFGKPINDLSLAEASILAGIFNSPYYYNPFYSTELATQRRATVLNLMVKHGYITEEQAEDANNIPVESLIVDASSSGYNEYQQFIDVVCSEISSDYGLDPYSVPMKVYTTMDSDIQDVINKLNDSRLGYTKKLTQNLDKEIANIEANDSLSDSQKQEAIDAAKKKAKNNVYYWEKLANQYSKKMVNLDIGVAITDTKDGSVRAVDGGRIEKGERIGSRATQKDKQPGSTAKPIFAYGPYIEYNNGNPGTVFYDQPYTYSNGVKITNSDGKYLGAITMRQALARSRNVPAVQAFQAVDKNKIAEFVNNLHINYCSQKEKSQNLSGSDCLLLEAYALGGGLELSPMDMAAAYGTFARGGYYIEPYTFTKVILLESGDTIEPEHKRTQVMSAETAYMITDILMTATKQGVGGNFNDVKGTDISSKTGTATFDDNWLKSKGIPLTASQDNFNITYSPDYVISMWIGIDHKNIDKYNYTTSNGAAAERKLIMRALANNIYENNSKFTKPTTVLSSKYELETFPAQLPSTNTPSSLISTEIFKRGLEPSEVSERFDTLNNPTNGQIDVSSYQVNLSWNGIRTPNAIDDTFLQDLFNANYGKFASQYLTKRIEYNNNNIGTLGYEIYLQTDYGVEDLGFTTDTYYTYHVPYDGNYTFIIKSAYSIFKSNMSTGLNLSVTVSGGTGYPYYPSESTDTEEDEPEEEEEPIE